MTTVALLNKPTALLSAAILIVMLASTACSAIAETDSDFENFRFEFTNTGPCALVVDFGGGVATPTAGTNFVPAIGVKNDVPIYGAGTVSIRISSAPAGVVDCGFRHGISRGAPYAIRDPFLAVPYCGGDSWIVTSPQPGKLTSYSGQIVRSDYDHC